MGIFSVFRKKATPEELEERSRKEREMAQAYYEKGQRLGRKLGLDKARERTNGFINRYPITFFVGFTVLIIVMFILNMVFIRTDFSSTSAKDINNVSRTVSINGTDSLQLALEKLYDEYIALGKELDGMMERDDLTAKDSARALSLYDRMLELESFFKDAEDGKLSLEPRHAGMAEEAPLPQALSENEGPEIEGQVTETGR